MSGESGQAEDSQITKRDEIAREDKSNAKGKIEHTINLDNAKAARPRHIHNVFYFY